MSSTSRDSARCSPITLRETDTTRLTFEPAIVDNPQNPPACVDGYLVFQKKGRHAEWEAFERLRLSTLKKGDELRLEVHATELLRLHQALAQLYELHHRGGVPMGDHTYVEAPRELADLLEADTPVLDEHQPEGVRLLARLIAWASGLTDPAAVIQQLEQLDVEHLENLSHLVGVTALRKALSVWHDNMQNGDEEFWQRTLERHAFLLVHLFAYPVIIFQEKSYAGGKLHDNIGGNYPDFLLRNELTKNAVLVEIKTPVTELLRGFEYRSGVYAPSAALVGAIVQVLTAKDSLTEERARLFERDAPELRAWNPECIVIVGNTTQLNTREKRRSFELYRHETHGTRVIAFDELFARTRELVSILERPPNA